MARSDMPISLPIGLAQSVPQADHEKLKERSG